MGIIEEAYKIRFLYRTMQITKEEAKERIKNYENFYNEKSEMIAKKHNVKPSKFHFESFMRI